MKRRKTHKRRKSSRKTAYNSRRKHTTKRRSRRNKGGSAWMRHAAKFLRAGKTLKQASAAYRKRR